MIREPRGEPPYDVVESRLRWHLAVVNQTPPAWTLCGMTFAVTPTRRLDPAAAPEGPWCRACLVVRRERVDWGRYD